MGEDLSILDGKVAPDASRLAHPAGQHHSVPQHYNVRGSKQIASEVLEKAPKA